MSTTSGITGNSSSSSSTTAASNSSTNLTTQDFITMMVTQLQNQDPLNPTSSQDLLQQESAIGALQASTDTQTAMSAISQQTQIGSASSLIGKSVTGIDTANNSVSGVVNSVSVSSSAATLNLDDGSSVALSNISSITEPASSSSSSSKSN